MNGSLRALGSDSFQKGGWRTSFLQSHQQQRFGLVLAGRFGVGLDDADGDHREDAVLELLAEGGGATAVLGHRVNDERIVLGVDGAANQEVLSGLDAVVLEEGRPTVALDLVVGAIDDEVEGDDHCPVAAHVAGGGRPRFPVMARGWSRG